MAVTRPSGFQHGHGDEHGHGYANYGSSHFMTPESYRILPGTRSPASTISFAIEKYLRGFLGMLDRTESPRMTLDLSPLEYLGCCQLMVVKVVGQRINGQTNGYH